MAWQGPQVQSLSRAPPEARVEDLGINRDHVARLDLGAPMASGRGSVPLSRPKLRCLRRGSDRSRLIASGKYAAEPFDEDQARPDESQPGAGQIIAGPPVVVLVDLEERPSVPG